MNKTFRIKELSKLTAVTVRTLHYYDEIGLLKPKGKTYGGHRLYSENDMSRLQQITTLKFLGFTLEQITQIVSMPESNIKKTFQTQAKLIDVKARVLSKASRLLDEMVINLDVNHSVNWKNIAKMIEVIQMSEVSQKTWYEKFLSKSEIVELEHIQKSYPKEYWEQYSSRWDKLFREVEDNLQTDPEGKVGMQLAKQWLAMVDEVYPADSGVRKKIWQGFQTGSVPKGFPYNKEVIAYMTKAMAKYKSQK